MVQKSQTRWGAPSATIPPGSATTRRSPRGRSPEQRSEADAELARRMLKHLEPLSPDRTTVLAALVIAGKEDARASASGIGEQPRGWSSSSTAWCISTGATCPNLGRAEGLRRLILALIQDVRAVLLVLAWQLARMQVARDERRAGRWRARPGPSTRRWPTGWASGSSKRRWRTSRFRYLEPDNYAGIERLVAEQRDESERYIDAFMQQLSAKLDATRIVHEINGRAKHIYSIWRKMQRKGTGLSPVVRRARSARAGQRCSQLLLGARGWCTTIGSRCPGRASTTISPTPSPTSTGHCIRPWRGVQGNRYSKFRSAHPRNA